MVFFRIDDLKSQMETPSMLSKLLHEDLTFNYLTNISLKYNFILFDNPKTGSTSLKTALHDVELGRLVKYFDDGAHPPVFGSPFVKPFQLSWEYFNKILRSTSFVKFCVVRNPYTRALSCFNSNLRPNNKQRDFFYKRYKLDQGYEVSFKEYLTYLYNDREKYINPHSAHWAIQSDLLLFDKINYDYVFKFEEFDKIIDVINKNIFKRDIIEHKHLGAITKANERLHDFYDADSVELVQKIYQKDFDNFDYSLTLEL